MTLIEATTLELGDWIKVTVTRMTLLSKEEIIEPGGEINASFYSLHQSMIDNEYIITYKDDYGRLNYAAIDNVKIVYNR